MACSSFAGYVLKSLRFERPLYAAAASGLPAVLHSVAQAHDAIAGSGAANASASIEWRFAKSLLQCASKGAFSDIALVRATLSRALASEGWLREIPRADGDQPDKRTKNLQ